MSAYIIEGGHPLDGSVRIHGAKNSVLPILAACLLAPGECVIHNCPELSDVAASLDILRHLGCRAEREGDAVRVDAARLLNIRGCSITIPHKIDIIPLLDKTSENVREMGACNTLYRDGEKICGENTDVIGFTAPLRKRSLSPETRVLVLGAGGVSRAAIAGLRRLGLANITLTNRRKERAEALCNEFGLLCAPWEERGDVPADLIINTTPLGMTGAQEHETPYPRAFQDNGIAYDLIYTPFQTRFLRDAAAAGWETVSGLDMFIGQGDAQFHLWTGHHLPEEAITAVTSALYGQ